jgi:hypothetical protein
MKILLSRREVQNILDVMDNFPQKESYEFDYRTGGGIGATLDMIIPTVIDGIHGKFTVEITTPEDW